MRRMLTQNSELREIGVYNWSIPAWVVTLSDGSTFNACPSAGACAKLCYARNGTYLFPNVRAAHLRNLEETLEDLEGWTDRMIGEIGAKRFRPTGVARPDIVPSVDQLDEWVRAWYEAGGKAVRIHDAGDFYSEEYLRAWLRVIDAHPDVLFYAYTKAVAMFRSVVEPNPPANFRWIYSMGGREDHMLDLDRDRHAEVFPDEDSIAAAGYVSQEASDLYAVCLATTRVGIPANNIRHFRKRQGGETFGSLQQARHQDRALAANL